MKSYPAKLNSLLGELCALSESASGRFNVLFVLYWVAGEASFVNFSNNISPETGFTFGE